MLTYSDAAGKQAHMHTYILWQYLNWCLSYVCIYNRFFFFLPTTIHTSTKSIKIRVQMPYHQYKQRTNRSIGCTCTSIMEHSQPQSESEEEMSFEQKISQNTSGDGHSLFRSQTFGQGTTTFRIKPFDLCPVCLLNYHCVHFSLYSAEVSVCNLNVYFTST